MNEKSLNKAINLIKEAKSIAIVPSKIAGIDSFAAGVGLYFMLNELEGKDLYFVYPGAPEDIPEEVENLIENDRIVNNVTKRELVVEIDYSKTPAATAHYNAEDSKLQIKLGPVSKGYSIMDNVTSKLVGFDFDLIIVLGAQELTDLGSTFEHLREAFNEAKVINIDNTQKNAHFGDVDLLDETALSLSQQILKLGSEWKVIPNEKGAKALLTGMIYKNGN